MTEKDLPPVRTLEAIPDLMTELHRLDLQFWGNARTAAVLHCVAAAAWRDGRPAKVSGIANSLGYGVATVHSHLTKLSDWNDRETRARCALVHRVTGGYCLTQQGDIRARRWAAEVVEAFRRFDFPVGG